MYGNFDDDFFSKYEQASKQTTDSYSDRELGMKSSEKINGRAVDEGLLEKVGNWFQGRQTTAKDLQDREVAAVRVNPFLNKVLSEPRLNRVYRESMKGATAKERAESALDGVRGFAQLNVDAADAKARARKDKADDPEFQARMKIANAEIAQGNERNAIAKSELGMREKQGNADLAYRNRALDAEISANKVSSRRGFLSNYMQFGASLVGSL